MSEQVEHLSKQILIGVVTNVMTDLARAGGRALIDRRIGPDSGTGALAEHRVLTPTGTQLSSCDGLARVFVFRRFGLYGCAVSPPLYCDHIDVARMGNGEYITIVLSPGPHLLHTSRVPKQNTSMPLKVDAGREYYFDFSLGLTWLGTDGQGRLAMFSDERARAEIRKLKPVPDRHLKLERVVQL